MDIINKVFEGVSSPFERELKQTAYDGDEVAACHRYFSRKPGKNSAQAIIGDLIQLLNVEKDSYMKGVRKVYRSYGKDFTDFDVAFPNKAFQENLIDNTNNLRTLITLLPKQCAFEADYFGIDLTTFKGCLLAWGIQEYDPPEFTIARLKKAIQYSGQPIFFGGLANHYSKPYMATATRRGKKIGKYSRYGSKKGKVEGSRGRKRSRVTSETARSRESSFAPKGYGRS